MLHPAITTIYGPAGTVKTSMTLTWPRPMALYNLEGGAHRAWQYQEGIDDHSIVERTFPIPNRSLIERWAPLTGYQEVWQAITKQLEIDLRTMKTVVWDTGTIMWALDRDAYLQELQQDKPRKQLLQIEYGEPNRRMLSLYSMARGFQTHLVVTHHETDEYAPVHDPLGRVMMDENNQPLSVATGKKLPDGFRRTLELSDWVLHTELETDGPDGDVPRATVEKSAYGLKARGQSMTWPTFDALDALVNTPSPEPSHATTT